MTQPAAAPRRTTGWIIAGVILLLLLAVAGVVTLVALDADGDSEPADPQPGQPATGSPAAPSGDHQFGPAPDLCERPDHFTPVFDILPQTEVLDDDERDGASLYQRSCLFRLAGDSSMGFLRAHAAIYRSPERARNGYRGTSGAAEGFQDTQAEIDAGWEEGVLLLDEEPRGATVQLVLLDGVLVLNLVCYILGDAYDIGAQQAGLLQVAERVREAVRQ